MVVKTFMAAKSHGIVQGICFRSDDGDLVIERCGSGNKGYGIAAKNHANGVFKRARAICSEKLSKRQVLIASGEHSETGTVSDGEAVRLRPVDSDGIAKQADVEKVDSGVVILSCSGAGWIALVKREKIQRSLAARLTVAHK